MRLEHSWQGEAGREGEALFTLFFPPSLFPPARHCEVAIVIPRRGHFQGAKAQREGGGGCNETQKRQVWQQEGTENGKEMKRGETSGGGKRKRALLHFVKRSLLSE